MNTIAPTKRQLFKVLVPTKRFWFQNITLIRNDSIFEKLSILVLIQINEETHLKETKKENNIERHSGRNAFAKNGVSIKT